MTNTEKEQPPKGFILSENWYDKLKFVALILLPALTTLYFTMGSIWHLPDVQEVIGTMTALDTFLGVVLRISTKSYDASEAKYDGNIDISETSDGNKLYSLELNSNPDDIDQMKEVTFKVSSTPKPESQV